MSAALLNEVRRPFCLDSVTLDGRLIGAGVVAAPCNAQAVEPASVSCERR